MKRLVIIDGNAILHRAYHALPPLTGPDGQPTNAVYGFASMLLKIVETIQPTHIAVTFDRPEPTFRKKLYKEYQSQRPEMEDKLVSQVDLVKEMVRAMGLNIFEKAGFEADDVIGTLVTKLSADQTIVVTGDKDLMQLVTDKIFLYMPTKGISQAKLIAPEDVKETLGVGPEKVIDYKALVGDPSDNYPGVNGIGPKTAVALLNTFGTVKKLYQALENHQKTVDSLKPKVKERLLLCKKDAFMSQKLAEVKRDVSIKVKNDMLYIESVDTKEVRGFFEKLEMKSILKKLDKKGSINTKSKARNTKQAQKSKSTKTKQKSDNKQMGLF